MLLKGLFAFDSKVLMMHQLQTAKNEDYIIYSDVRVLMSYAKLGIRDDCVDCNGVDNFYFYLFFF